MRHCPECGAGVRRDEAKFCEVCGFGLAFEDGSEEPVATVSEPPAPVTSEPPLPDQVTVRFIRPSPVLWWAVSGLSFAVFFPWLTGTARISNAMGVPLEFLWSRSAPTDGLPVGWVLLALVLLISIAAFVPILSAVRRLLGLLAVGIPIALTVQWIQALDQSGSADSWLSYIGVGAYVAFAAGAMVVLAPSHRGA